jgi:hypothetical protein
LKITSPGENENVPVEFAVEGSYDRKPAAGVLVRLFVFSPKSGHYWPSRSPILFDEANKRWRSSVRPAGAAGEERIIGIAVIGRNGRILCGYYDVVTDFIVDWRKRLNQHVGIPGIQAVPVDFKEGHSVRVKRV